MPAGLLDYLHSKEGVPINETDLLTPRNNLQTAMSQQGSGNRPLGQLQDQLKSVQISVEAKLETLLQHWNVQQKFTALQRKEDKSQRPVVLRKRKRMIKATMNWRMLSYQFNSNHSKANLIWNEKTREELRQAIVN